MTGLFRQWQPAYAEAGVATFPVDLDNKKPMVGNPLKAGRPASAQWARKFPEVDALGFACGKRNRLTVVDIDEQGDNAVADVMAILGRTPIVVRTASGKHHLWYRFDGEGRSVRRAARELGLPGAVDILGERGFAVAPPSQGTKGAYGWAQGSLADLAALPAMRRPTVQPANDFGNGSEQVREGERNASLFAACREAALSVHSESDLLRFARTLNGSGAWSPLPADEVERTAKRVWKYQVEGRNFCRGGSVVILPEAMAVLRANPDALYLYTVLRERHWGRAFSIANGWADCLPCGGWPLRRLQAARKFLLNSGLVVQVSRERPGVAAQYRFASAHAGIGGEKGRGV